MGGWAEGLECADLGARTPIGASGIMIYKYMKPFIQKQNWGPNIFLVILLSIPHTERPSKTTATKGHQFKIENYLQKCWKFQLN